MVNFMWEEGAGGWGPGTKKRAGEEKKKSQHFVMFFAVEMGQMGETTMEGGEKRE